MLRSKTTPITTNSAAVYPYNQGVAAAFTAIDRWGGQYDLHKVVSSGKSRRLLLPRAVCPIGETDTRVVGNPITVNSTIVPRDPEQVRVFAETNEFLLNGKSGVVQAMPGFGKTVCALQSIAAVKRKTLVIVTKEDLRNQWIKAIQEFYGLAKKDIGIIQGDKLNHTNKPVTIAMMHSLAKKDKYPASTWRSFGFIIWDECHHAAAESFSRTLWMFPAKLRMGLSATLKRSDGKQTLYFSHIGPVRVKSDKVQMVPKVRTIPTTFKIPTYRKLNFKKGEYETVQLFHKPGRLAKITKLMSNDEARNRILTNATVQAINKGRKTMVFSDTRQHLDTLYDLAFMRGIPEKHMDFYVGGMSEKEIAAAKLKKIIFATYQFSGEATDIPDLDTAILATPRSNVQQVCGRIFRTAKGKKQPVIIDLVDSDSWVLRMYAKTRRKYYESINANILDL